MPEVVDLGAEYLRWEVATAAVVVGADLFGWDSGRDSITCTSLEELIDRALMAFIAAPEDLCCGFCHVLDARASSGPLLDPCHEGHGRDQVARDRVARYPLMAMRFGLAASLLGSRSSSTPSL